MTRPPTPPSEAPTEMSEWRFHPIDAPTEWIEDLSPRWSPSHPSRRFSMATGTRSSENLAMALFRPYGWLETPSPFKFWLNVDVGSSPLTNVSFRESRYVAIKVSVARRSETNKELGIWHAIAIREARGMSWNCYTISSTKVPTAVICVSYFLLWVLARVLWKQGSVLIRCARGGTRCG